MLLIDLPSDVLFHMLCFLVRFRGSVDQEKYAKMYCRLKDDSVAARVCCKRFSAFSRRIVPPPHLRYPCCSVEEICNANLRRKLQCRSKRNIGYITLVEPYLYQRLWGVLPNRNCTAHDCHNNNIWNLNVSAWHQAAVPDRHVVETMQECLVSLVCQSEMDEEFATTSSPPQPVLHMPSWNFVADFLDFLCRAGVCVRHLRPFVVNSRNGGVVVRWVEFDGQYGSGL